MSWSARRPRPFPTRPGSECREPAPILEAGIDKASHLRTDESGVYWKAGEKFASHRTVNHSEKEYVRGDASTNAAENFFSILKRGIYGTYQHVSEEHLPRYLAEFDPATTTAPSSELATLSVLASRSAGPKASVSPIGELVANRGCRPVRLNRFGRTANITVSRHSWNWSLVCQKTSRRDLRLWIKIQLNQSLDK